MHKVDFSDGDDVENWFAACNQLRDENNLIRQLTLPKIHERAYRLWEEGWGDDPLKNFSTAMFQLRNELYGMVNVRPTHETIKEKAAELFKEGFSSDHVACYYEAERRLLTLHPNNPVFPYDAIAAKAKELYDEGFSKNDWVNWFQAVQVKTKGGGERYFLLFIFCPLDFTS